MGGLFGGNKETPQTPQPVTLPAPSLRGGEADVSQNKAGAEALKKAQMAGNLATETAGPDQGDYSRATLG